MAKTTSKKSEETKKPAAAKKEPPKSKATSGHSTASAAARPAKTAAKREASAPKAKKEKKSRCGGKTCRVAACKREYRAKGYCGVHYKKWRQNEFANARYKSCKDHSCFKAMAMNRHGYCEEHFQNYYVKGVEQAKVAAPAKPEKAAEKAPAAAAG